MKLISLCPSNTELVAYLGLTSSLVAVDDYSDWPDSVQHLPRLGPDLDINMDLVAELKPDLILASLSVPGMERNIEELEKRQLPFVIVPNPTSLKEVGEALLFVGKVTNSLEKATKVYENYMKILEDYSVLSKKITTPKRIYWEWWAKPIFTPGATNWLTEMSELAGGVNIFADQKIASVQTTWEEVCMRNPEVVCLVWVGVRSELVNPKVVTRRNGWKQLKVSERDQLYILDEPLFCRPSPRLLLGLQKIAALLHPDVFPSVDLAKDPLLF